MENIRHVILYCNGKAPDTGTHWKDEIPALAASEVIRDFSLIEKQGAKRVFHCLVEKNAQLPRIVAWIDNYNDGKSDADKSWYWPGKTADAAYAALWQDGSSFAHAIAERVLWYPIEVEIEGQMVTQFVTVYVAINMHDVSIIPSVLKQYGTRHKIFGVD